MRVPVPTRLAATLASLLLASPLVASSAARAQERLDTAPARRESTCVRCHRDLEEEPFSRPAKLYREDVHAVKGFDCVACHGGDGTAPEKAAAKDPLKGYAGRPRGAEILRVCGRCHSDAEFMKRYNPSLRIDQVAEYRTSVHGQRLLESRDSSVATCASCHTPHDIRPPADPASSVHPLQVAETCGRCHADAAYMAAYRVPTDQVEKYKRSVHWEMLSVNGDLSAPTCNDCHGNHGAVPPEVEWIGNVCGQCHSVMADLFAQSVHAKAFVKLGKPGCATCHLNHEIQEASDEMLTPEAPEVCADCHRRSTKQGLTILRIRGLIDALRTEYEKVDSLLLIAERAGMEVSQSQFELNDARSALIQARAAVHSFQVDSIKAAVDGGLEVAARAHEHGQRALAQLRFRRVGLAISVVVILTLIAGLTQKIRQLERKG